jgi:TatD DNase family protein
VIDTHCHLDVSRFDGDREAVLARAWAVGLEGLVIPGIGPSRWEALLAWPARDLRVQVALGLHPQLLPELDPQDDQRHLDQLDRLLGLGVAAAVGECGLDGPSCERAPLARQERVFRAHLALARAHRLPVLVHCLRAHPALQRVLADEAPVPGGLLLHSYSGSAELVPRYAHHGCHFSFAGPVSFPEARRPVQALQAVPLELLHAETDAPDQAPHPHRGGRSEPGYLPLIVRAMAAARGAPPETIAAATGSNARRLFARWG